MKKTLWTIGGLLIFLASFVIPILTVHGIVWVYDNFYSVIQDITLPLFGFVVLLSIFSIVPNFRLVTGTCIYISSSILVFITFFSWIYTAYFFSGIVGVFIPPLAIFLLFYHGQFLLLATFVISIVLIYGFNALGLWILTKYRSSEWLSNKISPLLRYAIAVIVGILAGQILIMPITKALEIVLNQGTSTSSFSSLSFVNFASTILTGFATGIFAGLIAGKRGKLVSTIAQFLPLIALIIFELSINRDLSGYFGQYGVSFWTWVGLIPAIIGGHYGVKIINANISSDTSDTNSIGSDDSTNSNEVFNIDYNNKIKNPTVEALRKAKRANLVVSLGKDCDGNKGFVDFSNHHFMLLVGQTGSGKSIFHNYLYKKITEQNTPQDIGFIFLDMTQVDSWKSSYTMAIETHPEKAIKLLEKLISEPINATRHTIVHIEECDMFQSFTERAENAVRAILKSRNDVTIVYSTSRPSPSAPLRQSLLKMVDAKVVFQLSSEHDLEYILDDIPPVMPTLYEKILIADSDVFIMEPFSGSEAKELQGFIMK